jgi:hypothetical protein
MHARAFAVTGLLLLACVSFLLWNDRDRRSADGFDLLAESARRRYASASVEGPEQSRVLLADASAAALERSLAASLEIAKQPHGHPERARRDSYEVITAWQHLEEIEPGDQFALSSSLAYRDDRLTASFANEGLKAVLTWEIVAFAPLNELLRPLADRPNPIAGTSAEGLDASVAGSLLDEAHQNIAWRRTEAASSRRLHALTWLGEGSLIAAEQARRSQRR